MPPKMNTHEAESNPCLKFVEGDLLLNDVKPLELEPPMCEGETKREIKDNNEINQCLKEILNTCNSEDEEVEMCIRDSPGTDKSFRGKWTSQ